MRRGPISLAVVVALLVGGPAHAATVNALQGQVLVNSGQGYRLVNGSTMLEPGATVVANPGAIAQVVYGGGCSVTVQPGSVYLVASQSPCQTGEPTQSGGLTSTSGSSSGSTGSSGGVSVTTTALIAVGAGGVAVGAYFLIQKAISP